MHIVTAAAPNSGDSKHMRPTAVFIGDDSLTFRCAEAWIARGFEIVAAVSESNALIALCAARGIVCVANCDALPESAQADYVLSIANLRVLDAQTLARGQRAAINFHDGPLPEYAGMYTPMWALIDGATQYGITFHLIEGGIDEGRILVERRFSVDSEETSLSLNTKNLEAAITAFNELLERLARHDLHGVEQDLSTRRYFARFDRPSVLGVLSPATDASASARLIRALQFGPYDNAVGVAKIVHDHAAITVGHVRTLDANSTATPGTLIDASGDALTVRWSNGTLVLSSLRTLGGEPLSGADAIARLRMRVGETLRGISPDDEAAISSRARAIARAESTWRASLSQLEPLEIADARPSDEHTDDRWSTVNVSLPSENSVDVETQCVAVALALLRLTRQPHGDLAFADLRARSSTVLESTLINPARPWRVNRPRLDSSNSDALAQCRSEFDRMCAREGFLRDLIQRSTTLTNSRALRQGNVLPFGVVICDDLPHPDALPSGISLAFCVSTRGSSVQLIRHNDVMPTQAADVLASRVSQVLAQLVSAPDLNWNSVTTLSSNEIQHVLGDWNDTAVELDRSATLVRLFESQVERTPDAPAVTCGDETLSYAEFNARVNQLAHYIRALEVGRDTMVGVHVRRSMSMVVAAWAVMKAGGAYLPLDPTYPTNRIVGMVNDSRARIVITEATFAHQLEHTNAQLLPIDAQANRIAAMPTTNPTSDVRASDLAYVIYTSGSSGTPKGVMVEHRNVVNFFAGMDRVVVREPQSVWLAVTSLSFDISVLELHWSLCRGLHVVVAIDERASADSSGPLTTSVGRAPRASKMEFGLFMWGNDDHANAGKYDLMLDSARFADEHDFAFVSTPERHFHAFGGPFPNPSVTGAAIAAITKRVQIRAGSCVLPLHHPIRVAEEWSVVDNLSSGRVAIAFAAGWQPNDFVLRPEAFHDAKTSMFRSIETVRSLWRGESVEFENPMGKKVAVHTLPRPVQSELPVWVTTAGNVESYQLAGRHNANVLTHLLGQSVDEVAKKVQAYRAARAEAGFDPQAGKVTLMLHTFVGDNADEVKAIVREPMKQYLASSIALIKGFAWAFPAFRRPEGVTGAHDVTLDHLTESEMDALLDHAFERYFETSGLFGTVAQCADTVELVRAAGVDEIACLVDYGVPADQVRSSLPLLASVVREARARELTASERRAPSLSELAATHGVTHFQCTPSMAKLLTLNSDGQKMLASLKHMFVGGEALPTALAHELNDVMRGTLTNMYGPTETTVWSSTQPVIGKPPRILIGGPIANTQLYVVDDALELVPPRTPGELMIAGDGVTRGYHDRPDLTRERFVQLGDALGRRRAYRTGDLVRQQADGAIEFLGRLDFQVKVRGHRIELGDVESALERVPGVSQCVVVALPDPSGDAQLVAYVVAVVDTTIDIQAVRRSLRASLPEYMIPSVFVPLPKFPRTPNNKIDRKALVAPSVDSRLPSRDTSRAVSPPANEIESKIAEVWSSVLGVPTVGRDDNFFDLGGHSLLIVQAHRVLQPLVQRPLSLTDMYRYPTVRALAASLGDDSPTKAVVSAAKSRAELRRQVASRRPVASE